MKNRMQSHVRQYLAYRRQLGFVLHSAGQRLLHFARFADRTASDEPLTVALALRWIDSLQGLQPSSQVGYLVSIRSFARFCVTIDPRTEVPPKRLIRSAYVRRAPHIYSTEQVRLLMRRARRFVPSRRDLLRPYTFETLIGLLASTGLRIGEALRLRIPDFDPHAGTLRVSRFKFSPERLLPLHPSTVRALMRYQEERQRLCPFGEHFFVSRFGYPVSMSTADKLFRTLAHDIHGNGIRPNPRWHDFRHSFATHWIATWSRMQAPISHHLLLLSRYLGHQCFANTWWYVSADRSALEDASKRFLHHYNDPSESPF